MTTGYVRPQWKGSVLCADWHCPACGEFIHTDHEYIFLWTIQCPMCDQWFALSPRIDIVAVDGEDGNKGKPAYEVAQSTFGD